MIALKNSFLAFSRRADARIGLLREIIERVQKGEDVDIEGLLGTGDEKREKEWEEGTSIRIPYVSHGQKLTYIVLREIEEEDQLWENSRKSKPKHRKNLEKQITEIPDAANEVVKPAIEKPAGKAPSGFY